MCFNITIIDRHFAFKLHRVLVYRLALYQVISDNLCFVFFIFYLYQTLPNRLETSFLLSLISFKVVLTVWIVLHLFALSVFHKNLTMLEAIYVVSSMVFAIVIFILMMTSYDEIVENYNYNSSNVSYNGSYTTYGPYKIETVLVCTGIILFAVPSVLVIIMVVTLCCRAFKAKNGIVSEYHKQHKKVLYEMLPLFVYIIFYLVVMFPMLSALIILDPNLIGIFPNNNAKKQFYQIAGSLILYGPVIAIALSSILCSSTLIVHILIIQCYKKHKRNLIYHPNNNNCEDVTIGETTRIVNTRSETYYSLPTED